MTTPNFWISWKRWPKSAATLTSPFEQHQTRRCEMTMKMATEIATRVLAECDGGWSVHSCTVEATYYWHDGKILDVSFVGSLGLRDEAGKIHHFDLGDEHQRITHYAHDGEAERRFVDMCVAQVVYHVTGGRV